MYAKKDRLCCSIADFRDLENETLTLFDVYSNDKKIKVRNDVFSLRFLIDCSRMQYKASNEQTVLPQFWFNLQVFEILQANDNSL